MRLSCPERCKVSIRAPPCEGATSPPLKTSLEDGVSIRAPPCEGATRAWSEVRRQRIVSIRAPPCEGATKLTDADFADMGFQSAPPRVRGRPDPGDNNALIDGFNPRPPV